MSPPPQSFLGGRVVLHAGDCAKVIKTMPDNSIDSVVTDPPYALVSIVKRFGKEGAAPVRTDGVRGENNPYVRASAGFMGKAWDNGAVAFSVEFWSEVLRVLKPGGHCVAFGGTRTYHQLAYAIEAAGFEIRDALMWHFGSGFPKSHDVSKGIDRINGKDIEELKEALRSLFDKSGLTLADLNARCGFEASGYLRTSSTWASVLPTPDKWWKMRKVIGCEGALSDAFREAEREIIGQAPWTNSGNHCAPGKDHSARVRVNITAPATAAARQWSGWGTALKPSTEIVCLARKPLGEPTVAANVLRWGTGAINVDACRVGTTVETWPATRSYAPGQMQPGGKGETEPTGAVPAGRWPANLIHDGSQEVLAGFPNAPGQQRATGPEFDRHAKVYGKYAGVTAHEPRNDAGSAARYFYTAKADSDDRIGSRHPTIKPVDLMQWLVRLVTPPGGRVLDCFAGSGTTGEAAWREGFSAILIEREAEYIADIARRMEYALAGPDARAHAIIKAKGQAEGAGPLFEAAE
jgi:DNA modification methylase